MQFRGKETGETLQTAYIRRSTGPRRTEKIWMKNEKIRRRNSGLRVRPSETVSTPLAAAEYQTSVLHEFFLVHIFCAVEVRRAISDKTARRGSPPRLAAPSDSERGTPTRGRAVSAAPGRLVPPNRRLTKEKSSVSSVGWQKPAPREVVAFEGPFTSKAFSSLEKVEKRSSEGFLVLKNNRSYPG